MLAFYEVNMKTVAIWFITVILLTIPASLLLFATGMFRSVVVAGTVSMIVTVGIYIIARKIKHAHIRKRFFVGCYLVASMPIVAFAVFGVIRNILAALFTGYMHHYGDAFFITYIASILLSLIVPHVIFAHLAYILHARSYPTQI